MAVIFTKGNWSDFISSENPTKQIQTPNLSGIFEIKAELLSRSTVHGVKFPHNREVIMK